MKKFLTIVLSLIIAIVVLYFIVAGILLNLEKQMTYFPSDEIFANLDNFDFDEQIITDQTTQVHTLYKKLDDRYVIIYAHGNGDNLSRLSWIYDLLGKIGYSFIAFEYPGYGQNPGKPSEIGIYENAQATYNYLLHTLGYKADQIVLYGQSLGGAVAIEMASRNDIRAVITEDTFTSTFRLGELRLPQIPFQYFITNRYHSLAKVEHIKAPKLFIHAKADQQIPFTETIQLFEKAKQPKLLHLTDNANHLGTYSIEGKAYEDMIKTFIETSRI